MKRLKLWIHNKEFDENELVLNPREFPDLKIGDVFEVYHPEIDKEVPPGQPRVLLQVSTLREDFAQKEVVSVEQTVANAFNLRNYKDVFINRVDAREVVLDLVEISFKEQYISRADMWNLKKILVGGCVYLQKKIDFFNARMQSPREATPPSKGKGSNNNNNNLEVKEDEPTCSLRRSARLARSYNSGNRPTYAVVLKELLKRQQKDNNN